MIVYKPLVDRWPLLLALALHASVWSVSANAQGLFDRAKERLEKAVEEAKDLAEEIQEQVDDQSNDDGGAPSTAAGGDAPEGQRPLSEPFDNIDPLAPDGFAIGMMADEASTLTRKLRYLKLGTPDNTFQRKREGATTSIQFLLGDGRDTRLTGPVSYVQYRTTRVPETGSMTDLVERVKRSLNAEGVCEQLEHDRVNCSWSTPSTAPLVQKVTLIAQSTAPELVLTLEAVPSLEAKIIDALAEAHSWALDMDLVAPYGVSLGMSLAEARAALMGNGFRRLGSECEFSEDVPTPNIAKRIKLTAGHITECNASKPVSSIYVELEKQSIDSPAALIPQMNALFGAEGDCAGIQASRVRCSWESPPNVPFARNVRVSAVTEGMDLEILAVGDIESRVQIPADSVSPETDQSWWTRELAQSESEAQTTKFTGSERFPGLSTSDQQRLAGEAETVYGYCRDRTTFASFHDCRCVAGKFIDKRLEREEAQRIAAGGSVSTSRNELIGIADEVADQCPNKPGAADYGYTQCNGTYGTLSQIYRQPERLEPFCTCYANSFSDLYMRDPRSHWSNITGVGAGAAQECQAQGILAPGPF